MRNYSPDEDRTKQLLRVRDIARIILERDVNFNEARDLYEQGYRVPKLWLKERQKLRDSYRRNTDSI